MGWQPWHMRRLRVGEIRAANRYTEAINGSAPSGEVTVTPPDYLYSLPAET